MRTTSRTLLLSLCAALLLVPAVSLRFVYAQTPAQMEYERQQREYRQAQERSRQEEQRLQQLQQENARRQQEESSRAARESSRAIREYSPGTPSPQYPSTQRSNPSASPAAGGARAAVLSFRVGIVTQSGAVNPLARQGFFLLKNSMDDALTKGGFRPPPGMSPRTGMEFARINKTSNSQQAVAAILADSVFSDPVFTDLNGKAQFPPLHPGTYYLVGGNLNPRLAWNLKVDLKSGANSVTLDQRNATPFDR